MDLQFIEKYVGPIISALPDKEFLAQLPKSPNDSYNVSQDAEEMRRVTLGATAAPYEMMKNCCRVIEILEEMNVKCSRLLISDVGCGAISAGAALKAAAFNVFINTKSLKGDAEADAISADAEAMLSSYPARAEAIASSVLTAIKGE